MAQMVLVSGTQPNPFFIMVLYMFGSYNFAEKSMPVPPGVTLIMLYSLRSMASGLAPDGHGHRKPPETIHNYNYLKLL